jgi:hypothetical protein
MKKKEMNEVNEAKEVYFFDKMNFNENKALYEGMLIHFNALSQYYQTLGLKQPFTKEIMLQAINDIEGLKNSIVQDLTESMLGGNVPAVVHRALKGQIERSLELVAELAARARNEYNTARQFTQTSLIRDYTLLEVDESGAVIFNETSEQRLRDMCSIYLTNAKQKRAVNIVIQINERIDELKAILSEQMTKVPESHKEFVQYFTESFNGTTLDLNPWVVERLR